MTKVIKDILGVVFFGIFSAILIGVPIWICILIDDAQRAYPYHPGYRTKTVKRKVEYRDGLFSTSHILVAEDGSTYECNDPKVWAIAEEGKPFTIEEYKWNYENKSN